ncbi:MAG: hypothetical protein Q4B01_10450 [Eubacteriales bacterium]|nr:hypothetical protein [Eubacteriales bacterium]
MAEGRNRRRRGGERPLPQGMPPQNAAPQYAASQNTPPKSHTQTAGSAGTMSAEHEKVLQWLKTAKFRKQMFGGVSEHDVWKKLEELNALYEAALVAERARYDTLLNAYSKSARAKISEYQKSAGALQAENEILRSQLQANASSPEREV